MKYKTYKLMSLFNTGAKRWARHYVKLSPLYTSEAFNANEMEKYVIINTRLFSMYLIRKANLGHYDSKTIEAKINQYFPSNYEPTFNYLRMLFNLTPLVIPFELAPETIRFNACKQKVINGMMQLRKGTNQKQFRRFVQTLSEMSSYQVIDELDSEFIDGSLKTIHQMALICDLNLPDYAFPIGQFCIARMELIFSRTCDHDIVAFIQVMQKIEHSIDPESILHRMLAFYSRPWDVDLNAIDLQTRKSFYRQALPLLSYFIHLIEYGKLCLKYCHSNHKQVYQQLIDNCPEGIDFLLKFIMTKKKWPIAEKIILYELLTQLQELQTLSNTISSQQHQTIYRDIATFKSQVQLNFDDQLKNQVYALQIKDAYKLLSYISRFKVEITSLQSRRLLKQILLMVSNRAYAKIITSQASLLQMLQICRLTSLDQLVPELKKKCAHHWQYQTHENSLSTLVSEIAQEKPISLFCLEIGDIMEVKNISKHIKKISIQLIQASRFDSETKQALKALKIVLQPSAEVEKNIQSCEQTVKDLMRDFRL